MSVSYKKLFDIIKENNISRSRLRAMTGIGEATISKLQHNMNVNVDVIERICVAMKCRPNDIMEVEMRTTAKLIYEGLSEEVVEKIVGENLFQYPTERTIREMVRTCLKRLKSLEDETLGQALATQPSDVSKQICLYKKLLDTLARKAPDASGRSIRAHPPISMSPLTCRKSSGISISLTGT